MTPSLSCSALKDTRARPDGDHDGRAGRRYLFTLIARSTRPRGTWQPCSYPVLGGGTWSPGGTWRSRSCPVSGDGSRGHVACGSPRAALCQETGAGATGHVVVSELPRALVAGAGATRHVTALELPCARRREPRDTWTCAPVLYLILTWSLYAGYPVFRVPAVSRGSSSRLPAQGSSGAATCPV
jgi:hypothetical protein